MSKNNAHNIGEEEEEEHRAYAIQLFTSLSLPMTMQAAIDLDIFEIAKAGHGPHGVMLSPLEIVSEISCKNPIAHIILERILKLLTSFNVLTANITSCDTRYGLAPVAKYFVKNEEGFSFAPLMTLLQDKVIVGNWYHLKDVVVEGGVPFDRANGASLFDYGGVNPRFNELFNQGMINHTKIVINELLLNYRGFHKDMESITLVDVAGGLGANLNIITSMYPKIKGINFDLPQVICHAPPYQGVQHVEGNMFESVPKADVIFMKWILHYWSDEHCLKLLKNCYKALSSNGKIILVEGIIPEGFNNKTSEKSIYQADMITLNLYHGGKERNLKQFQILATQVGFAGIKLECTAFTYSIMEMYK